MTWKQPGGGRHWLQTVLALACFVSSTASFAYYAPTRQAVDPGHAAPSVKQGEGAARLLTLGQSVTQNLTGDERHAFQVVLVAGQYLRLCVKPSCAAVTVSLSDPDGRLLIQTEGRQQGSATVSIIAQTSGAYRLEVRLRNQAAANSQYELRIEAVREAAANDDNALLAESFYMRAEQQRWQWQLEASQAAIKDYQQARVYWHAAHEPRGEASALESLAELDYVLSEYQSGLQHYQEALSLRQAAEDQPGEANVLRGLGEGYIYVGEYKKARDCFERALSLSRALADRSGEARALTDLGTAYFYVSDDTEALNLLQSALALAQAVNDCRGAAKATTYIGNVFFDLGAVQQASDQYNRALPLWQATGDGLRENETLHLIALAAFNLGDRQKAFDLHTQTLQHFRQMGNRWLEAAALRGIGYYYESMGEHRQAFDFYNQSLLVYRAIGYRKGELQRLRDVGRLYNRFGDHQKALDCFQQMLALSRILGDRRVEAYAFQGLGLVYGSLNDRQKALENFAQGLALHREVQDRLGEAETLNHIGSAYDDLGEKQKALAHYQQALRLQRATKDRVGEALTSYNVARAERDLNKLDEARTESAAGLELIESLRANVVSPDLRAVYLASVVKHYELDIDLQMRSYRQTSSKEFLAAALQISERRRARTLLESLVEARADIRQGIAPTLLERERALQQLLNSKAERQMRLLGGKHTAEQAAAVAKEVEAATVEYQQVRAQIRARSPRYAALTQPLPLTLAEIQRQVLDPDSLLLEYALGDERSYLWAITTDSITSFELPRRADIEMAARRVYQLLTAPNQKIKGETAVDRENRLARAEAEYPQAAADLSRMVIGPAATLLGNRRLLVVAEGALQYVPFAALPAPPAQASSVNDKRQMTKTESRPLIADHEIVNLPSASALAVLRRELDGRKPAEKAVAVIADPVFSADDERLKYARRGGGAPPHARAPQAGVTTQTRDFERAVDEAGLTRDGFSLARLSFSRREAEAIFAAVPAGQGLKAVDFDASRATATGADLSRYRIVHFATHGLLNNEHPELSGVVLSLVDQDGRPQNGFLRLHEIYNLNLPAELVVLSACQTGLGKEIKGEGLVGLTRGFMYAGAARVLASLWKVDDAATAELMRRMYARLLRENLRPAAALRRAQVEMWQEPRWHSPYYWAAFVLQGEWR